MIDAIPAPQKRMIIDSAFASISADADYLNQEALIAEEFSRTDWEAFEISERELTGIES
jgi:mRNA interferase MazF